MQETKKIKEKYLANKLKQFIQAQDKINQRYEESFMRHEEHFMQINSKLDQIVESQFTCFQKLQMCTPMDCLKKKAQGESVWDDENTFGQNNEVTFELCIDNE